MKTFIWLSQLPFSVDGSPNTLGDTCYWSSMEENTNPHEPTYTNADYIHHFTPNVKVIVSLRNPTTR